MNVSDKSTTRHNETGRIIKFLRDTQTQQELADAIGVSREIIMHWESGRRGIKAKDLEKLADYFNVSSDFLLGRESLDNSSPDQKLRLISEYTGLSNDAVEVLHELKGKKMIRAYSDLLSLLLIEPDLEYLLGVLEGYFAEEKNLSAELSMSRVDVNIKDFSLFSASNALRNMLDRIGPEFKAKYMTTGQRLEKWTEKKMEGKNGKH